ncbi:RNA-directed DNA polymerase, eukaryota, reverse transcriptase zinc-binding domain protein [Tanacetum coccineum]
MEFRVKNNLPDVNLQSDRDVWEKDKVSEENIDNRLKSLRKWNVQNDVLKELKRSVNKYVVLQDDEGGDGKSRNGKDDISLVDRFLKAKMQPPIAKSCRWSDKMITYFKENWEKQYEMHKKNGRIVKIEDVLVMMSTNRNPFKVAAWNIRGLSTKKKQKEVKKLILEENIQVCAVLETRLCYANVNKVGDFVFNEWEWVSNMENCDKESKNLELKCFAVLCMLLTLEMKGKSCGRILICITYRLVKKLKHLKFFIKKLDKDNCNVHENVSLDVLKRFNEAVMDEEKVMYQQAKFNWLKEGDKNTTYFHKVVKGKRNLSRVDSICDENDVTDVEIKQALFDTRDNKFPSPYGYSAKNFKKAWGIIGEELCLAVREFFYSRKLLGQMNATLVSLIPKMMSPNKLPVRYLDVPLLSRRPGVDDCKGLIDKLGNGEIASTWVLFVGWEIEVVGSQMYRMMPYMDTNFDISMRVDVEGCDASWEYLECRMVVWKCRWFRNVMIYGED